MCDLKPGDEVECVDAAGCPELERGRGYQVRRVLFRGDTFELRSGGVALVMTEGGSLWVDGGFDFSDQDGTDAEAEAGYDPRRFRKVQRRNDRLTIEAFSVIKDGQYEEPKRSAPAKKRERV